MIISLQMFLFLKAKTAIDVISTESQKAVSVYFKSNQILPFGFECRIKLMSPYTLFAREQESEQNSSALVTVWRVVIEKCVTGV